MLILKKLINYNSKKECEVMRNNKILGCFFAVVSMTLSGCATITTGVSQPFTVNTPKADGAKCILKDSKGAQWVINATPMTVEVRKGDGPMTVSCSKDGFSDAEVIVEEGLAGMTFGNVLLGGGIGIVVDAVSGAAQEYPDDVSVWLEPKQFSSKASADEWLAAKKEFDDAQEAKIQKMKSQSSPDYSQKAGNE
ncbi:MAG: hypothetical protein COA45_02265 [Zetaproteobacteria bacterium]|nr:MAG: hypothetical protein COA45_02265 [Zetaproteobacteria bacterium]